MTRQAGPGLAIELHADAGPLEETWRDLETTGAATAFQCYDFVAPLYAAFVAHGRAEPVIVLVRDAASGRPLMILPLCRHREAGIVVIGFADIRVADYCAPVLAPDFDLDAATFRALWKRIVRSLPPCDLVRLRKLPAEVGGRPNPLLALGRPAPYHVRAHGIAISHPWRERSVGTVPKRYLGEIRRSETSLSRLGEITLDQHDGGQAGAAAFETLHAMRRARFAALGRDDVIADPMWADFYRDLASGRTTRAGARLIVLASGGVPVACGLGLVHDGAFLLLIPSFDMERFGRFSPGKLLIFRTMEALAEAGLTYFDLTIGDEPYKHQFGTDDRDLYEVLLPRNARGRWAALVWRLKVALRRFPTLRQRLKRLLGRG